MSHKDKQQMDSFIHSNDFPPDTTFSCTGSHGKRINPNGIHTFFNDTHIDNVQSSHGLECVENTNQTFHTRLIMPKPFIYTILLMHINETIHNCLIGCLTKCHVHDLSVYDM